MAKRFRSLIPGSSRPAETPAENPMNRLRQFLVSISQMGAQSSEDKAVRKLLVGAAKIARAPGKLREAIEGMAEMESAQIAEAATWMTPQEVAEGKAGRFDSCDLRNWLALAEQAGVPAIPAREIASFSPEDYAALVGEYGLDRNNPRIARVFETITRSVKAEYSEEELASVEAPQRKRRTEEMVEQLYKAMDDVPEGWMVRSNICGGNNLKALAGCGVTETFIPEVRFDSNLEVGPGWVRTGNRRRIDIQDKRTMDLYVRNDTIDIVFLARPWVVASRWLEGRDPHRAGTPIDIPGSWPAEWRAFVRGGKVTGVSAYYAWAGQVDAESAQVALKVRELAQAIVDKAIANGQKPRSMDKMLAMRNPVMAEAMEELGIGEDGFECTLDFIETANGPVLLEGGPGCGLAGGGHPCGFAGDFTEQEVAGQKAKWMRCEGVAFRTMDHILMGEPQTWALGDKSNAILTWEEAETLAKA